MNLKVKREEKLYTTKYFDIKYGIIPEYKESGIVIPDCYFEYCGKDYAVEVTRYFQQNSEKEFQEFFNAVEKCFDNDFFKSVYTRLGKRRPVEVGVSFYNVEEMKTLIINNIKYIKFISVNCNYYFDDGSALFFETPIENINIVDFMDRVSKSIDSEKKVRLEVRTKNKYNVIINFQYCSRPYYGMNNDKKVIPLFCWFEDEDELYSNIINSIENKNNKLINEYIPKLIAERVNFDFYNLVIYGEGIGADLDEEKLFNMIKKNINLKYDEIAIFLWKKLMVINSDGFEVYSI